MLVWVAGAATFIWFNLGALPDRIISGTGPGGLRYAPKEALWFFPALILVLCGLGWLTEYLRRVSPATSSQAQRTKPGMTAERTDLQRATVAVFLSWVGLSFAGSVYFLWLLNMGHVEPGAVFGWRRQLLNYGPLAIIFAASLIMDRRYALPRGAPIGTHIP